MAAQVKEVTRRTTVLTQEGSPLVVVLEMGSDCWSYIITNIDTGEVTTKLVYGEPEELFAHYEAEFKSGDGIWWTYAGINPHQRKPK